jgi:hypothetical protein
MTFEYRVVHLIDDSYIIGEIYYNDQDKVEYWTSTGVELCSDSFEDLKEDINYINKALELPIIEELDILNNLELNEQ